MENSFIFGCCSNMLGSIEDPIGRSAISAIKSIGFDYIELPLAQITELSDATFRELVQLLKDIGLPCYACNNLFPVNFQLTGPGINRSGINSYVEKAFQRVAELGAKTVVFGSGKARNVPSGYPMEKANQDLVVLLKDIAKIANSYGIVIAIESLNSTECNILNHLTECYNLARVVSDANVQVLLDTYHMQLMGDNLSELDSMMEMVAHVHVSDPPERTFPRIQNLQYYEHLMHALCAISGVKTISIEGYTHSFEQDSSEALYFLRRIGSLIEGF